MLSIMISPFIWNIYKCGLSFQAYGCFLAVFLLLISNCITLWSESVECVLLMLLLWLSIWVVTPLAMWDLCYSLHSSVPFLPLCWAPLLPDYSHLKQPVDLTIPMGLLYALWHIPEQLFPHLSGPENQHLRCFLNILIPTSSPVDLGQSPRNCMLLNMQYP